MNRPTISETLAEIAYAVAKRATCSRLSVGAVIHDSRGVVLSTGYNGALAGMEHCDHTCTCEQDPHSEDCQSQQSCKISLHAEENAVAWAARRGVATEGQQITITHSPCYRCARLLIQVGIAQVTYLDKFIYTDGLDLLEQAGISVIGIGQTT